MIFSTYVSRMEAANMKLNAYIKAGTRAILAFSESLSNILNPYYPIVMSRKEFRKVLSGTGLEKYEITERLFPKKKKRGSMRRARMERKWGKFNDPPLPDGVYIDEWVTPEKTKQVSYDASIGYRRGYRRTTNQIFDDFYPPMIAPIDVTDDQFDGDPVLIIPGPFEGEKEQ